MVVYIFIIKRVFPVCYLYHTLADDWTSPSLLPTDAKALAHRDRVIVGVFCLLTRELTVVGI